MRKVARQNRWKFMKIGGAEALHQGNPGELLQNSFDLRNWNGAFAEYFPLIILQSDDS
jgi:hypothetical protein